MAKDACLVGKIYLRRMRAHDKTGRRLCCLMCSAVKFIGCVANVGEYVVHNRVDLC